MAINGEGESRNECMLQAFVDTSAIWTSALFIILVQFHELLLHETNTTTQNLYLYSIFVRFIVPLRLCDYYALRVY